ncbi:MAG TPA: DMT family transporter, partial [Mycobacteriales bacterium]|nr:DMT family transporter [Mycobacteriales bacterium]
AGRAAAPAPVHRPPPGDIALIVVAVLAVSTSGPLITAAAAPSLAVAFWRNALASGVLMPWTLARRRVELRGMDRRERRLVGGAGVLLAAHFATWVPSLAFTSVASATALVATQPVWAALLAHRLGRPVPRRAWLGIAVAVVGAAVISGVDVAASRRALVGDGLALAGAVFAAAYVTVGAEVRRSISTTVYTSLCYALTAGLLLVGCLIGGFPLAGYRAGTWVKLGALTVGPQLLGHSVFNRVLRTTSPTLVSLAILFEAPGAAAIAAIWLHQHPRPGVFVGLAVLMLGLAVVLGSAPAGGSQPLE